MNDPAVLRKMIAELELENKKLKEVDPKGAYSSNYSSSTRSNVTNQDKNWMQFSN